MFAARTLLTWLCLTAAVQAEVLTLAPEQRPAWLAQEGIVMAGSWEPLYFRARRGGAADYTPTVEQRAAYDREHSPEMVARLKALGVNFVMIHGNKGGGLEWERESMADAVRFAKLCHDQGMRVGVYVSSATLLWDVFFKEVPAAKDWVLLGPDGQPQTYGKASYRYYWNRNHPDAAAYHRRIVEFAIQEIKADLIHCDNYFMGPGYDACSIERFRRYLAETFSAQERAAMGAGQLDAVRPPDAHSPELLNYAWREFSCRSLADSYGELTRWARTRRPDILMECNPSGAFYGITPPVDHGRLLPCGEAFWDETGPRPGYNQGQLNTRIVSYKIARCLGNMAFTYTRSPLEIAESLAFNRDCLGSVCWFEYGELRTHPSIKKPMSDDLGPSIRFYHQRRDLYRDGQVIADAAVLRSFPSQVFGGAQFAQLTHQTEQALIAGRVPFQIIYDPQLTDLGRYRALVLAGCVALDDQQVEQIRRYVNEGGRLCVIGPLATHDGWNRPRAKPALDDLPVERVVRASAEETPLAAVRRACEPFSVTVDGPDSLRSEFVDQSGRRLVHLVNYRADQPAREVRVQLRLPAGKHATSVLLASPEHAEDRTLEYQQQDGVVSFTVPEVGVYEIAVINLE